MPSARQQAMQQINQKYAGTTTTSAPPKQNILQKAGNFVAGVGKAIASPFARLGVEAFNTTSGIQKAIGGDIKGANAELDKPRNLPLLGETKPTLTNSTNPGLNEGLDIAGQGVQLGADAVGGEGGFGSGVINGAKTGAALGATQGFGNALTETQGKSFGQNVGNIAGQTAIGGATGGVLGGATNAIHPIFSRSTPILDPNSVPAATAAREAASTNAVDAVNKMNQTVGADSHALGQEFQQGAQKLESANPNTKLSLSGKTLDALNSLKESKKFVLPEGLDQESNPLLGSTMGKDFLAKNAGKLNELQNAGKVELSHTQAQDLIRRLNKLTFDAKASGDLAVNQQTIGLTNELKQSASKTFGPEWDKVYSKYSSGRAVMDRLDGIVNLDPKATPMDLNKQLQTIQKLGETPEGHKLTMQAIEAYKAERGIDLTDPIGAVNHILKAQGELEIAQKGSHAHQILQALKSPNLQARQIARLSLTLLGITAGATAFRKQIGQFFSGQ